jgi:hypothetical protein
MKIKNLATALFGLSLAATFIYRDALAQQQPINDCPGMNMGCIAATAPPCSASSSGNCVYVTSGSPAPGGAQCAFGPPPYPVAWKATAPNTWTDCIPRTGQGACGRYEATCQTILVYGGWRDCAQGSTTCGVLDIYACAASGNGAICVVQSGPGGP